MTLRWDAPVPTAMLLVGVPFLVPGVTQILVRLPGFAGRRETPRAAQYFFAGVISVWVAFTLSIVILLATGVSVHVLWNGPLPQVGALAAGASLGLAAHYGTLALTTRSRHASGVGVQAVVAMLGELTTPLALAASLSAAIGEELLWRGMALPLLVAFSGDPLLATVLTTAGFSSYHLGRTWYEAIGFAVFGAVLAAGTLVSGGLVLAISAHATYNLLAHLSMLRACRRLRSEWAFRSIP